MSAIRIRPDDETSEDTGFDLQTVHHGGFGGVFRRDKHAGLAFGACAERYTEPVRAGKLYIYRVLQPERATLSIGQVFDGNWQIQELLQSHNRPVSTDTREHVESWISQFFDMH